MSVRTTPTVGFVSTATVLLWLCLGLAASVLWPIYEDLQFAVMATITIAVGSVIALAGTAYRWSSFSLLIATLIAFALLGVPLAVPSRAAGGFLPTPEGMLDLITGVALGWKQLLTIGLPVGTYQALLVPAFALLLAATVVSLSVIQRARYGELAVFGPAVVFLVASLFGRRDAGPPITLTIAFTAAVILVLIWRRWYRRRQAVRALASRTVDAAGQPLETIADSGFVGVRPLVSAALVFAVASGIGVGLTSALPPVGERVVLRTAIVQPFDPADYASPLAAFRSYLKAPRASETLLTVDGLPAGARLRVATLDHYDGIVYSVGSAEVHSASGTFTRVPHVIDQSDTAGRPVTLAVEVNGYEGVWLPTVGETERVAFAGARASTLADALYFNDVSGTAAVPAGLAEGDSYTLSAVIPSQPEESELRTLEPAPVSLPPLEELPEALAAKLESWVVGVAGDGARLVAMLEGLAREGFISHGVGPDEPPSRSGHASDRITELVSAPRMIGDEEQYSVTAALMARELGFPARVVFGFAPAVEGAGPVQVTGADVSAWVEVSTSRYGWVALDPTPPQREIPDEMPEEPTTVARPHTPVQPPTVEPERPESQLPPASTQEDSSDVGAVLDVLVRVAIAIGWTLIALAIALSPFLMIIAAKWRRRRLRRRAPSPIERIAGGWQEFEDAVLDHGYRPPPAATRIEVAQTVGGTQPLVLAAVVDRAVFSPDDPDGDQAEQLWRSVDELLYGLSAPLTRSQRLAALLSLQSLGGYSVARIFRREVKEP